MVQNANTPNIDPMGTRQRRWNPLWWIIAILVVIAIIAVFWPDRETQDITSTQPSAPSTTTPTTPGPDTTAPQPAPAPESDETIGTNAPATDIDILVGTNDLENVQDAEDVLADNEPAPGQRVKIRGEINRVVGAGAFLLDSDGAIGGDEILVIYPPNAPITGTPENGKEAVVEGEVTTLNISQLDPELRAELNEEAIGMYEGQRVILVSSTAAH